MNVVPLAAIKGGRAVELAWHTEEGKEVKGIDFNNIRMSIYVCLYVYIYIYSLVIPSYSLQSIVVIVVLFTNTTELGHHRAQKTSANTTVRLQANCRSWTKVVDHLLVRNEVDSHMEKKCGFH